jgi:hypothetical protein
MLAISRIQGGVHRTHAAEILTHIVANRFARLHPLARQFCQGHLFNFLLDVPLAEAPYFMDTQPSPTARVSLAHLERVLNSDVQRQQQYNIVPKSEDPE